MPSAYTGSDETQEGGANGRPSIEAVRSIKNKQELDTAIAAFLESLTAAEFDLREAYEYTMALPKTYYSNGSFDKWIRVGWALRNISPQLFIVWVAFSAKADGFSYSNIRTDLWDRWSSFPARVENGLTKRSIMYWVKQDNPDAYKVILGNSVEQMIDATLESAIIQNSGEDKRVKGSGDYDIAVVLFHLFREEYKCVSVKGNLWYRFHNHRWKEIDSGTTLRKAISNELRDMYTTKLGKLMRSLGQIKHAAALAENGGEGEEDGGVVDRMRGIKKRIQIVSDIVQRLGKTADKKNIMTEAKELFFDPVFLEKLDQDPYLMCFQNGVVDFKQKTFRRGLPEDYMSKCTNINYRPIDQVKDRQTIAEINDFMLKLFPNPELHRYMWDHLASTLIGNNMNQTFNMYIGIGQNGKSVLVELMKRVLGEYKADVPLSLLTQQRTRIGGLAPELVALKGARYAVMQEPSKGDRINEGIMKQVTGGDPIQARAPYMPDMVTFIPQFKLVVCLNVFMELYSQDHGTRRRIRVVEFESLFTENPVQGDPDKPFQYKLDKTIKEKFENWKEVFAAMLVELAYVNEGNVKDCDKVMAASTSYLDSQDYVGEFITERIEKAEHGCVTKPELTHWFKEWYTNNMSGKVPNIRDVVDAMEKRFGKMQAGAWHGVRFKPLAQVTIGSVGGSNFDDGSTIHTSSTHRAEESGGGPVDDICNIEEI
jgi:P4 family phage/plasmid primase-like protien